jgi:hypothetical protein
MRRRGKQSTRSAGDADDVIRIDPGFDRFRAQVVAEACREEGFSVELLTMDDLGTAPGLAAGVAHQLLVHQSEVEQVCAIVRRSEWRT